MGFRYCHDKLIQCHCKKLRPFLIITHGRGWFGHDPTGVLDVKDVESVLYYFEDMEDYEKCIELKKVIDEL